MIRGLLFGKMTTLGGAVFGVVTIPMWPRMVPGHGYGQGTKQDGTQYGHFTKGKPPNHPCGYGQVI